MLANRCRSFQRNFQPVWKLSHRLASSNAAETATTPTSRLRNIGILAHIDAGKTTTTERMLYYSGTIRTMGEVHHGNTVTDFMEQERERGITIASAAVSFPWMDHQFNLIDTPGHIDFTMEVEQALNVMDGAVVVLDASAGVEAQTLTVWRQADKHQIPRIIFVNKMDRTDSDLRMCCDSIERKLDTPTINLHYPITESGRFIGVIDILNCERFIWALSEGGKTFKRTKILDGDDMKLRDMVLKARSELVDKLSTIDDNLAKIVIENESLDNINTPTIMNSLRKVTLEQAAIPVLCGSSYKNIGVQLLMDAVISYLPSPLDRNHEYSCFGKDLCAKAFKIMHDKQRGPLVFFRLYSGDFVKGQKIYNIQQEKTEQSGRLYMAYADDFEEVSEISNGNVAVVAGLKSTTTADLITNSPTAFQNAKKQLHAKIVKRGRKDTAVEEVSHFFKVGSRIPEPVFFCSIEPPSLAFQSALDQALVELQREDPSLRVTYSQETGQTVLGGMGELHLEIIKDRIVKQYKIEVELGQLQIAYKESPSEGAIKTCHQLKTKIGSTNHFVSIAMSLNKRGNEEEYKDVLKLDKSPESASNLANMHPKHLLSVKQGLEVALCHGPKIGCKVTGVEVVLHFLEVGRGTSETVISTAVTQCVQKILNECEMRILQPMMHLEIVTSEDNLSKVMADLSRRHSEIQHVGVRGSNKVVYCTCPLSQLLGYSTALRTITSGTATFSMEFSSYEEVRRNEEAEIIKHVVGF